jgi:hypothetical protein
VLTTRCSGAPAACSRCQTSGLVRSGGVTRREASHWTRPVGTLDSLMALMDELAKHDTYLAASTVKVCKQLVELKLEAEDEDGTYQNAGSVDVSKVKLDELLNVGQGVDTGLFRCAP